MTTTNNNKQRRPSKRITQILANNIKTYRKKYGLSQEALAGICDLHRTYIGSVEREERNLTLSTLEVIAKALEIDVIGLLTDNSIELNEKK